jgi:hypothetical protein
MSGTVPTEQALDALYEAARTAWLRRDRVNTNIRRQRVAPSSLYIVNQIIGPSGIMAFSTDAA